MPIDFGKIVELKRTREEIENLWEYEKQLASPVIPDSSLMKKAYEIFSELQSKRTDRRKTNIVTQRKKFIFIALYIFAPGVLLGDKMPRGFRRILSETLDISSHTVISNNCDEVVFLYQNYSEFSQDVEEVYDEIMKRLRPAS